MLIGWAIVNDATPWRSVGGAGGGGGPSPFCPGLHRATPEPPVFFQIFTSWAPFKQFCRPFFCHPTPLTQPGINYRGDGI